MTLPVLLPIVSTAAAYQMPHSFALENCSSLLWKTAHLELFSAARDHVFTSSPPLRNYYQYGSIIVCLNETISLYTPWSIEMVTN